MNLIPVMVILISMLRRKMLNFTLMDPRDLTVVFKEKSILKIP